MKELLQKYGSAIGFVLRFLVVYTIFTLVYHFYNLQFGNTPNSITTMVTRQSAWFMELFGFTVEMLKDVAEPFYKVILNGKYVARIIEGCNSVSVLMLFVTFIIAFKGKVRHTIVYGLMGVVIIYLVNLLRIAILAIAVYRFPEYTGSLHNLVFPAIIYGTMFILWIIWIRQFASK